MHDDYSNSTRRGGDDAHAPGAAGAPTGNGEEESGDYLHANQSKGFRMEEIWTFRIPSRPTHLRCLNFGDAIHEYKVPGGKSAWIPLSCDLCINCLHYRVMKIVARFLAGVAGTGDQTIVKVTGFDNPGQARHYTSLSCHSGRLAVNRVSVIRPGIADEWEAVLVYAGVMAERKRKLVVRHAGRLGLVATVEIATLDGEAFAELVPLKRTIWVDPDGEVVEDPDDLNHLERAELSRKRTLVFQGDWPEPDEQPSAYVLGVAEIYEPDEAEVPEEAAKRPVMPLLVALDLDDLSLAWIDIPIEQGPVVARESEAYSKWYALHEQTACRYAALWMSSSEFRDAGLPALRLAVCEGGDLPYWDRGLWGGWRGPAELIEHTAAYWCGNAPWREFYAPVLERLGLVSILPPFEEPEQQDSQDGDESATWKTADEQADGPSSEVPQDYVAPSEIWDVEDDDEDWDLFSEGSVAA